MFYTDSFLRNKHRTLYHARHPLQETLKRDLFQDHSDLKEATRAALVEFSLVLQQSKKTCTRRGLARECNQLCEGAALSSREDQQLLLLCCLCAAEQPKCEQHQPWQSRVFTCCKFFWPLLLLLFAPLPCPSAPPARV